MDCGWLGGIEATARTGLNFTFVNPSLPCQLDNFNFSNYFWPDSGEMNCQILANISFNKNDNPRTNCTFHSTEKWQICKSKFCIWIYDYNFSSFNFFFLLDFFFFLFSFGPFRRFLVFSRCSGREALPGILKKIF